MKLYSYYRSSASYRVRIVLNLKGIAHNIKTINLKDEEQCQPKFQAINNAELVPVLELDCGQRIAQSTAIIDYLEQHTTLPSLLTNYTDIERALIQEIVNIISCDIHPLNNLRVLKYLSNSFSISNDEKNQWYQHWVHKGFQTIEGLLKNDPYAIGESISMADVYLVPQVYNAKRFNVDMSPYPKILAVHHECEQLKAFANALPENQSDAK